MRINKFIAQASGLSRRVADKAVEQGHVRINGHAATPGQNVTDADEVTLNHKKISAPAEAQTIMLNKPAGYVVSRDGQGNRTIYDLLPPELHRLKPIGRLDKDSSGLLLLTTDGQLAQELTHPKYQKTKIYEVTLNKPLSPADKTKIERGILLDDGPSAFRLRQLATGDGQLTTRAWLATLAEGRNRQIRRTFAALGYNVQTLHRTQFGNYQLTNLAIGTHRPVTAP